jgi:hypothetical protein
MKEDLLSPLNTFPLSLRSIILNYLLGDLYIDCYEVRWAMKSAQL